MACFTALHSGSFSAITAQPGCAAIVKSCSDDIHRLCDSTEHADDEYKLRCMRKNRKQWSPACSSALGDLMKAVLNESPCAADLKANCKDDQCPFYCFKQNHNSFSAECKTWAAATFPHRNREPTHAGPHPTAHVYHHRHGGFGFFWSLFTFFAILLCLFRCHRRSRLRQLQQQQQQQQPQSAPAVATSTYEEDLERAIRASLPEWTCARCTLANASTASECGACGAKPGAVTATPAPAAVWPPVPDVIPVAPSQPAMPPVAAPSQPSLYPSIYAAQPVYAPALVQYRPPA